MQWKVSKVWNFEFWITFLRFWNAASKKRKKSSFLDSQKNVKHVFSNYAKATGGADL